MAPIKIHILAFLLAFSSCISLQAQKKITDSLVAELRTNKEDSTKVNTLNFFAWELRYSNYDSAIILSKQAILIALKRKWLKGVAKAYLQMGGV